MDNISNRFYAARPVALSAFAKGTAPVVKLSYDSGSPAPAPVVPVRKEFPETWLWQTIAAERFDKSFLLFFSSFCSRHFRVGEEVVVLVA